MGEEVSVVPIFVDPSGRRKWLVRFGGYLTAVGCVVYIGLVAAELSGTRVTPLLGIPGTAGHRVIAGLAPSLMAPAIPLVPYPLPSAVSAIPLVPHPLPSAVPARALRPAPGRNTPDVLSLHQRGGGRGAAR